MVETRIGKYRLLRKIATGGMAEVWLAQAAGPAGFQKTLVLKRILPHLAEQTAFRDMFLNEARLAALLNHPNIVQIFDLGEADGSYFIAMEYIDGPNLRKLSTSALATGFAIPYEYYARIIALACEGLGYAHDFSEGGRPLKLIHRDISPDNILLSRAGSVKVVDFGIAKAVNQVFSTEAGGFKGKLGYVSPEQVQGQIPDKRTDIFALGVVFYELIAGMKPFKATSDVAALHATVNDPPIPLAQKRADCPPELSAIIERALRKRPEDRYPDCRAMRHDLEKFLVGRRAAVSAEELARLVAELVPPAPEPEQQVPALDLSADATTDPAAPGTDRNQPTVSGRAPLVSAVAPAAGLLPYTGGQPWLEHMDEPYRPEPLPPRAQVEEISLEPIAVVPVLPAPAPVLPAAEAPVAVVAAPPPRRSRRAVVGVAAGLLVVAVAIAAFVAISRKPAAKVSEVDKIGLEVVSTPPGARLRIDGNDTGKDTPAKVDVVAGTTHVVELSHPEYVAYRETLFAAAGQPMHIDIPLVHGARVAVSAEPAGATVEVDGEGRFQSPGSSPGLAPGKHVLIARAPGHACARQEFDVRGTESLTWAPKLLPAVAVSLSTTPPGAQVQLDGKPTGQLTPAEVLVPIGKPPHLLRVVLPGYLAVARKIPELAPGDAPRPIAIALEDAKSSNLRGRIKALEQRVAEREKKLRALEKKAGKLVTDSRRDRELQEAISGVQDDLDKAQVELNELYEQQGSPYRGAGVP